MMFRRLVFAAALLATPLAAQDSPSAGAERGTYLVYAEDNGAAFVSREPSLTESGVWPLEFYYFQGGETVGTAQMAGSANCTLGVVSGRLTHINGAPVPPAEAASVPEFSFDRAGGEGGDQAIVDFICGGGTPAPAAGRPIARSVAATADLYKRLAGMGLSADIAAQLAARNAEDGAALARTAVPAEQQAAVIAALSGAGN